MAGSKLGAWVWWLIGAIVAVFLVLLVVIAVSFSNDFAKELRYIKMEIGRTEGSEQKFWKRKKKKLWLSLFPFVKY